MNYKTYKNNMSVQQKQKKKSYISSWYTLRHKYYKDLNIYISICINIYFRIDWHLWWLTLLDKKTASWKQTTNKKRTDFPQEIHSVEIRMSDFQFLKCQTARWQKSARCKLICISSDTLRKYINVCFCSRKTKLVTFYTKIEWYANTMTALHESYTYKRNLIDLSQAKIDFLFENS